MQTTPTRPLPPTSSPPVTSTMRSPAPDDGVGAAVRHLDEAIAGLAPGRDGAYDTIWTAARDSAWQAVDGLRSIPAPDETASGALTAAKSGIANLEENLRKLADGADAFIDHELFSGNVAGAVTHFTTARDLLTGDSTTAQDGHDGFL